MTWKLLALVVAIVLFVIAAIDKTFGANIGSAFGLFLWGMVAFAISFLPVSGGFGPTAP